jgi:hypothetical protein
MIIEPHIVWNNNPNDTITMEYITIEQHFKFGQTN